MKKMFIVAAVAGAFMLYSCGNSNQATTEPAEGEEAVVEVPGQTVEAGNAAFVRLQEAVESKDAAKIEEALADIKKSAAEYSETDPAAAEGYLDEVKTWLNDNTEKVQEATSESTEAVEAISSLANTSAEDIVSDVKSAGKEAASDVVEGAKESVNEAVDEAKDEAKAKADEAVDKAASKVNDAADEAKAKADEAVDNAASKALDKLKK